MKPTNITEARRYIANAKEIISKKLTLDKEGYLYNDPKYVKMAGHTAYAGVLVALEPLVQGKKSRLSIDDYKQALSKKNYKAVHYLNSTYNLLHLSAGYDGELNKNVLKDGLTFGNMLINWAEENLPQVEVSTAKPLGSVSKKPVVKIIKKPLKPFILLAFSHFFVLYF